MTMVTDHELELSGFTPGTVYYLHVWSEDSPEITPTFHMAVATVSESSGAIEVYFNHITDPSVATESEAVWTLNITDTIISYINGAEQSLDITMYDLLGAPQSIFDAINARYEAGVQVRYITDNEPVNVELDWLNANIPLLRGNETGIMHDKFIIIDADDVGNSWVMTGSFNQTFANLGWDYNNLICIQDQSLARSFRVEFNEMWGSDAAMFDELNAKFSSEKTNNTPHHFIIDGINTELYFSPSDGTSEHIVEAIDAAENEIAFAVMAFTENSIGTATGNAYSSGLDVTGIIDYVEFNGSEYPYLQGLGIDVMDYVNENGTQWPDGPTLHHKYAILDYAEGRDSPVLITGSHNWTASANSINDENTLMIHDHRLANIYYQEYMARRQGLEDVIIDNVHESGSSVVNVYPNPCVNECRLDISGNILVYNQQGILVKAVANYRSNTDLNLEDLSAGYYLLIVQDREGLQLPALPIIVQ